MKRPTRIFVLDTRGAWPRSELAVKLWCDTLDWDRLFDDVGDRLILIHNTDFIVPESEQRKLSDLSKRDLVVFYTRGNRKIEAVRKRRSAGFGFPDYAQLEAVLRRAAADWQIDDFRRELSEEFGNTRRRVFTAFGILCQVAEASHGLSEGSPGNDKWHNNARKWRSVLSCDALEKLKNIAEKDKKENVIRIVDWLMRDGGTPPDPETFRAAATEAAASA